MITRGMLITTRKSQLSLSQISLPERLRLVSLSLYRSKDMYGRDFTSSTVVASSVKSLAGKKQQRPPSPLSACQLGQRKKTPHQPAPPPEALLIKPPLRSAKNPPQNAPSKNRSQKETYPTSMTERPSLSLHHHSPFSTSSFRAIGKHQTLSKHHYVLGNLLPKNCSRNTRPWFGAVGELPPPDRAIILSRSVVAPRTVNRMRDALMVVRGVVVSTVHIE